MCSVCVFSRRLCRSKRGVRFIPSITRSSGIVYGATYDDLAKRFYELVGERGQSIGLQSLYYSVDSGPVTLLTAASVATGNAGSGKKITVNYTISDGTIQDVMTLIGNTLSESIVFNNTSGNDLNNVSIFQYSDFVLGAAVGNQTVSITPAVDGGYATANQSGGGVAITWNGDAIGYTTLVQANSSGSPFGAFIGSGTDLDNVTLTANNTYAVFGYEFSGSVAQGNSLTISENTALPVPEPSSLALIGSGMFVLALVSRRRRN